jgi:hypothetical protein
MTRFFLAPPLVCEKIDLYWREDKTKEGKQRGLPLKFDKEKHKSHMTTMNLHTASYLVPKE